MAISYQSFNFIRLLFLSILVILSNCTREINRGADFNSDGRNQIVLNKTNREEIIQLFGIPYKIYTAPVRGETHELLEYYYQAASESQPCPLRLLQIELRRNVVNGYFFLSNLSLDLTTFDGKAIATIELSRTTKNDIRKIFGNPHGRTLLPSARASGIEGVTEIWMYRKSYVDNKEECGLGYKKLNIFFDAEDKVLRVTD